MKRKSAIVLALVAVILGTVVVLILTTARNGVRPIDQLDDVYYSTPTHWADFYQTRAPEGVGWVHLPQKRDGIRFKSSADPELLGFVRSQVCGECHPDKYHGQRETAHFRTSSAASLDTILGEFGKDTGRLTTRDPHLHFEMLAENNGFYQRVVVEKNGSIYEHAERFDIVVGSGNHGQTYLYWRGNELYQLPIGYFSELGGWVNSPGFYRDGTADFARGIGHRCLDCHATFIAAAPGGDVLYDRDSFVSGVTCVRCHGHGWAHVQYHRTHPNDKAPRYIVHPGELPRDRANEVCAQCHSGVGELLAPAFTYQPGERLDAYLRLDTVPDEMTNDDPHAANQLARLVKSRCYQASGSLTCAMCHNPHRQERGDLKLFAERCAKCHAVGDCRFTGATASQIKDHCVECHMPSRLHVQEAMQTSEGELLPRLRDHYIKVWPDVSQTVIKKILSK